MRTSQNQLRFTSSESHPNKHQSFKDWCQKSSLRVDGPRRQSRSAEKVQLESLILAQNERWRRALHMQVERGGPQGSVERRTGE